MALPLTWSRRKRQASGVQSDVYDYEDIPLKLRTQIGQIISEVFGDYQLNNWEDQSSNEFWDYLVDAMRRELGVDQIAPNSGGNRQRQFLTWMKEVGDVDEYLDGLELSLRVVDYTRSSDYREGSPQDPDKAIAEVNARILEAGVGYQFQSNEIVRVDSLILHKDVVLPALALTSAPDFAAANGEYLAAHEAYRHAQYETCITECAKAFESTLKVIADKRGWAVQPTDPAAKLIEAGVAAGFIQSYLTAGFTSLKSMLTSGVPTVRNKAAAHGAGVAPRQVPQELAAFQLHQTGAVIVFLIESHLAQP